MRPRSSSAIDGESLQADVMRFMAIIAFCLVAIMALVRDVSPPTSAVPEALPEPVSKKVPKKVSKKVSKKVQEKTEKRVVQTPQTTEKPAVVVAPTPAPTPVPIPTPAPEAVTAYQPPPESKPAPVVAQIPPPKEEPAPEISPAQPLPPIEHSEPEEGLVLRFNSDRDFLRLISRGEVEVYLFRGSQSFKLAPNYSFAPSQSPRQVYEMMPNTIPQAIQASAANAVDDVSRWQWGVSMPGRIQTRIEALVSVARNGQLVINRFGEVQHRPPLDFEQAEG